MSATLITAPKQLSSLTSKRYAAAAARRYPGRLELLHASFSIAKPGFSPILASAHAILIRLLGIFSILAASTMAGITSRPRSPASCQAAKSRTSALGLCSASRSASLVNAMWSCFSLSVLLIGCPLPWGLLLCAGAYCIRTPVTIKDETKILYLDTAKLLPHCFVAVVFVTDVP